MQCARHNAREVQGVSKVPDFIPFERLIISEYCFSSQEREIASDMMFMSIAGLTSGSGT